MKRRTRLALLGTSTLGGVLILLMVPLIGGRAVKEFEDANTCDAGEKIKAKVAYGTNSKVGLKVELGRIGVFTESGPECVVMEQVHNFAQATDTARFYYERKNICPKAADDNPVHGIDTATLFFYTGHGTPNKWQTQGSPSTYPPSSASTGCMIIGNPEKKGMLRYYWKCSCQVFAHGPKGKTLSYPEYPDPGAFAFQGGEENILETWGSALGSDFRMACGLSTRVTCEEDDLERVWLNKKAGLDVADSFVAGLHSKKRYVPICLTKGSRSPQGAADPASSPLYDKVFFSKANEFSSDLFYIEYIRSFDQGGMEFLPYPIPRTSIPFLNLASDLGGYIGGSINNFFHAADVMTNDAGSGEPDNLKEGKDLEYFHDGATSRVAIKGSCPGDPQCKGDDFFFRKAQEFLVNNGWDEEEEMAWPPDGSRLLIDSYDAPNKVKVGSFQKGVVISVKRVFRMPILGKMRAVEGNGTIILSMNNEGDVIAGWKRWPKVKKTTLDTPIKSTADASAAAFGLLGAESKSNYRLGAPRLVYRDIDGELAPVYLIDAEPLRASDLMLFPPRELEVPAKRNDG